MTIDAEKKLSLQMMLLSVFSKSLDKLLATHQKIFRQIKKG